MGQVELAWGINRMLMLNDIIYQKLLEGSPLEGLGLEMSGQMFRVKDLKVPQPQTTSTSKLRQWVVRHQTNTQELKKGTWANVHFSKCDFSDFAFMESTVRNCVFEKCTLRAAGFWNSQISNCMFKNCDMRDVAFGGSSVLGSKCSQFENVQFVASDLRDTAHSHEAYSTCSFLNSKLEGVDFLGAIFTDCIFEGELKEVCFRNQDPTHASSPKNRLTNCSFRDAKLLDCQFIKIDLDPSILPKDEDILLLPRGSVDLLFWLESIEQELSEGRRWFIKEQAENSGAPGIASISSLSDVFTASEIQKLVEICQSK